MRCFWVRGGLRYFNFWVLWPFVGVAWFLCRSLVGVSWFFRWLLRIELLCCACRLVCSVLRCASCVVWGPGGRCVFSALWVVLLCGLCLTCELLSRCVVLGVRFVSCALVGVFVILCEGYLVCWPGVLLWFFMVLRLSRIGVSLFGSIALWGWAHF